MSVSRCRTKESSLLCVCYLGRRRVAPAMVANTGHAPTYPAERGARVGALFLQHQGQPCISQSLSSSTTRGCAESPTRHRPRYSLRSRGDVSFFTYLPCTSAGLDTSFLVFLRDSILADDARRRPSSLARAASPSPPAASRAGAAFASGLRRPRPPAGSAACWRR